MARVTVEDCIEIIPNRFELVVLASQRAKQISSGAPLTVDRDNDKDAVVALREIADSTIETDALREEIIQSQCRKQASEDFEAAPFAGEIEDHMRDREAEELMAEEMAVAPSSDAEEEAPEGMSFEDENIEIED